MLQQTNRSQETAATLVPKVCNLKERPKPNYKVIFAGNTQKDSYINYSKIAQKYSILKTMTLLWPQIMQL